MSRFFRFSPSRLALVYIGLGVLALALFAVLLWYAWRANLATFREYVGGEQTQKFSETFDRQGAEGLSAAIAARLKNLPRDEIIVFADPAKQRLAGNLNGWPPQIPETPGTYGLVIAIGGGSSMRVVASHVILPGGYHLLLGRESVRFESLVERFWYGIIGAIVVVLLLGGLIGWLSHRALLNDVNEISRTALAISKGNLSRRVATRGGLDELDNLAQTINGMLEQLAAQNVQLESEIGVRRQTEHSLHRAHEDLESLVAERTAQLARSNESLRRNEAYLAEAQRLSHTGTFGWIVSNGDIFWSEETYRIFEYDRAIKPTVELVLQRTHPDDRALVRQLIDRVSQDRTAFDFEHRLLMPNGSVKYVRVVGHPSVEDKSGNFEFVGAIIDITERKQAEEERQDHLWLLESMDQINRAIQGTNDVDRMMSDVLDTVLSVFNCDRAWLIYPCDPETSSWRVPMEHVRPEFPGAFALGLDFPVDSEIVNVFQTVRSSSEPVRFGPESSHPLPQEPAKRFSIQSMIAMALYPKGDKPYMLGLHQCSYPRLWTAREERLFQGIGRRLEDALTSLLVFRNLGESERKLEEAQRLAHVGYWERDTDTDLITWSDETYRIFGLEPQKGTFHLSELADQIHPEDKQLMIDAVTEALRGGRRYDVEYRVIRPNGEVRLVHSQGDITRDESGRPRRMFGSVQDITERKLAEQRLMVQHKVTAMLAEAATLEEVTPKILETVCEFLFWDVGTLWRIDREAAVLRCVEVWHKPSVEIAQFEAVTRERTLRTGVGLPGRIWSSHEPAYIPDVTKDPNFPRGPMAEREGLHAAFGFPILLGGQVLGVIEFFSREIRQPDQELLNTLATIGSQIGQFIERKRAEQAVLSAQAELAHVTRVATVGELTASIAHEVNQPLAAIVNNANACLNWLRGNNMEEARTSVELIRADGHRAGEIIGRIRALVKKAPPQKDWLDINQTIREVVALAHSEVERNRVALETELSDAVQPLVFADRIQLQQVILNLIMNAVEAMSETSDGRRQLLIRTDTDESESIAVAVQDSGPGVKPEDLHRLFTPFYTTKPQGMGMGLAISRSIIEAHGGKLRVMANEARGATFQFTLPTGHGRTAAVE
jgi:PAS domain S-box-containing protein